jgi:peptidoglycan/xylan/chitin deacetylase (PgdA/CDA1 family)
MIVSSTKPDTYMSKELTFPNEFINSRSAQRFFTGLIPSLHSTLLSRLKRQGPLIFATLLAAQGCSQQGPECAATAIGIKSTPIRGESLQTKQLSFVFESSSLAQTLEHAEVLATQGISATFFIEGQELAGEVLTAGKGQKVERILDLGHDLGNQGYKPQEVESHRNLESQYRAVDWLLTKISRHSNFYIKVPEPYLAVSTHLNNQGLGKYLGPIGSATPELPDTMERLCRKEAQQEVCLQELTAVVRAADKGIISFPDLAHFEASANLLRRLAISLKQFGFSWIPLEHTPEIAKEISLRNLGTDSETCNDYRGS